MLNTFVDICGSDHWTTIELIEKGWSGDLKYCVTKDDGSRRLLRISQAPSYDRKKYEYDALLAMKALPIRVTKPISFGRLSDGQVYTLLTWMDGLDAEERLPLLTNEEQYQLGSQSGEILKVLHQIASPQGEADWSQKFNRKITNRINAYRQCHLSFDGDEAMIAYIETHRYLLKGRPQCFHHGDYHCGNMVIDDDLQLGVVDFNRCDVGDPWEEHNRIVWDAGLCPIFASGRLHAYFDGDPPNEFFQLLALYMACNTLSSIPWALGFGAEDVRTMLNQAEEVLAWYDGYTRVIPKWYQKYPCRAEQE